MNITVREAHQRMNVNRMRMTMRDGEYRVNFAEDDREATAYYTDCLTDAVLTAGNMRIRKHNLNARTFLALRKNTAA
jgi:hypothetical protein